MTIAPIQFCLDSMRSLEGHTSAADYSAESLFMSKIHEIDNMDSATFDKIYEVLKTEGWKLRTGHWPNMMTLAAHKGKQRPGSPSSQIGAFLT